MVVLFGACQNGQKKNSDAGNDQDTLSQEAKVMPKQNVPNEMITYTVSLGVMPDNNYEGQGMLIGKVNDAGVAHKAGILKGDVVVQIDDYKVNDLVSYTKALGQYKKGDNAKVVVKRDDQLMTMLVEF
jgi:S1-C subfamily serine protease